MKKIGISFVSAIALALVVATTVFAAFTNGDFESGDFTAWSKATFLNGLYPIRDPGGTELTAVLGPFATQSQTDPHTNGNLHYPPYDEYVARINSDLSWDGGGYGRNGNTLSQIATVDASDVDPADSLVHVRFVYAGVMVNPLNHAEGEKPYIYVVVKDHTKSDDILFEFQSYAGESGKGWIEGEAFDAQDHWQYLDWQYVDIAESVAHPVDVGDEIYVEVTAAGCQPGGHPGYAYVDEFSFLQPAPIITATDSPDPLFPSDTLTYTFNYRAINAVSNPVIYIPIPAQTTFSSISDTTHCTYDSVTKAVTCNMPSMLAGASGAPFTMNVIVAAGAGGSTLTLQNYTVQGTSTKINTGTPVTTTVKVPINLPPVIDQGAITTVVMDEDGNPRRFNLTLTATDPENDPLKWKLIEKTAIGIVHINPITGVVSYRPPFNYYGNQKFKAEVRDPYGGKDTITVIVKVMPVNDPLLEENSQYFSYNGWHRGKDVNALNGDFIQSQDSNASLNVPQGATDITIFTREGPDQGIVEIDVDGTIVKRMDLYSPTETWNVKIKTALLPTAKKVTVIAANAKNPASTDTFITFDGYQFTPDIFHHDDLELVNWPNTANLQTNTETYRASMRKGSVILKFSGQQITWNTYHGPEAGIAEVYIDGELAQTIDLYNATPDWNTPVSFTHLLYGKHTIEIVVTGTKNTASSNYWVVMDSLDIE